METLQSTIFIEFDVNTKKITFLRNDKIIDYDSNVINIYLRVKYKNLSGDTVYLTPSELENYDFSLYTIKPTTNDTNIITGEVTDELKENINGGVVKFEIPRTCTNRLGIAKCEIHINQENKRIASSRFILDIKQSLVTEFDNALLEDEDFPVLKRLIFEVQKANNINYIDDTTASTTTTYSSDKIENIKEDLSSQIKEIVNNLKLDLKIENNLLFIINSDGTKIGNGIKLSEIQNPTPTLETFGEILSSTLEWNVLGDSITFGYGVNEGEQYHQLLKSKYNITAVNNYGINSSEIATGGSGGNPMCVRYADMSDTADLITVFGGVNDYLHDIPIGTINDSETTTFYGALNTLTQGLKNKFQDKKIIFFTPMYCKHGAFSTNIDGTNNLGNKLIDYVTAIKLVCNKENIKIIDIYSIDRYNANTRYSKYFSDGLHPNKQGHADFANKITTAVPSYVTNTIKLKSISLEQNTFDLQVGDSCQLNAILNPINATNKTVIFTADNDNVTVNSNGLVTTLNAGNSIITIVSENREVQTTCTININEKVKTFLYNNGDQCESITGGYTTSMVTFNSSNFTISHSAAGKIETVNTFTMNKGDKVFAKIIGYESANTNYEIRLCTGSNSNTSKKISDIQTDIESNGYSLIAYEYTSEQTGTLSIQNYFGKYTLSEWYIIRA